MGITRPPEFSCLKAGHGHGPRRLAEPDRKSTRLNSSHSQISYAVFCLKKKQAAIGSVASPAQVCGRWRIHVIELHDDHMPLAAALVGGSEHIDLLHDIQLHFQLAHVT